MLTNKEIKQYSKFITEHKKMCKCGHRVFVSKLLDKVICDWCGEAVYLDGRTEFKYELRAAISKQKLEGKNEIRTK